MKENTAINLIPKASWSRKIKLHDAFEIKSIAAFPLILEALKDWHKSTEICAIQTWKIHDLFGKTFFLF